MREHEVPTHVQAEDRVLLWFTFPQVVALIAVCALSYGAYHYAPGPSEARMALAVLLGLFGVAMVVGKIGGRRLPLVAADLLKYRLGARLYAGSPAQLARSEPPAPVESGPGPLSLMARRGRRGARRMRVMARRGLRKMRKSRSRRNGRMPFRPHGWFGKRRGRNERKSDNVGGRQAAGREGKERRSRSWRSLMAVAALAVLAAAVPQAAVADGDEPEEGQTFPEIEFELPESVPGRRIFVEGLRVSGDGAAVTLRAATGLDLRVRAFGGQTGLALRFWGSARLEEGERIDYSLPLNGPVPSFTFSWEDELGQAGAVTVKEAQIPYPLPAVEGELCDLRVASLGWTPGTVEGAVESECVTEIEEAVELQTVAGHADTTETTVMEAEVTAIGGTVTVGSGGSVTSVPFVPGGETLFSLPVAEGEAVHVVTIGADLEAGLRIPIPPLTQLTHHPEWTEYRTETVSMWRPGTSRTVSETVSVTHDNGATTQHVVTATLSIPGETVHRDVTLTIVHPEHVRAEVVERPDIAGRREESLEMASSVGGDDPFEVLALPEPEPEPEPAEQTPGGNLRHWFDILGWEWPW